ncbi:MAG: hypothetical protein DYH13_00365 [Alphaproteobacteria bacterium PRO2]|nr:hypothetical protein [Alphaproteobacteria bacterium PRO2]
MPDSQKPSALLAFVLATGTLIATSGTTLADEPTSDKPPPGFYKLYKAHSLTCDSRERQFIAMLSQKVIPLHPEKVSAEVYRSGWKIFQESATEMDNFMHDVTAEPLDNDQLEFVINQEYNRLKIAHIYYL